MDASTINSSIKKYRVPNIRRILVANRNKSWIHNAIDILNNEDDMTESLKNLNSMNNLGENTVHLYFMFRNIDLYGREFLSSNTQLYEIKNY